ncbi:Scr1 family TA system antitoxin-like transcriptional regulator [Streptomyces sp. NPDC001678]|uniref:Scr1 family TA system antitoxin-like transcriptional regulator n=1 Tax=Streptomyces sp. NPDC001678 TaxID=3364599 RepID=UPI0036AEF1E9
MSEPESPEVTFGKEIRYARGQQLASVTFAEQCDKVFGTPGVYARMRQRAVGAGNPAYLAAVSEHPRITVQVLPFGAPPRGTPFILLGRPDGSEVLYAESYVRGQFHDSPEAVAETISWSMAAQA